MVPLNINTQQLRYFMELAKCLNFTRAAANLYVAQPTLSQQIAELETQLGVTLFNRSSRSVTLTPAGAILQSACPEIMARLERVQQHMLITAAGFSGSLNIGFLNVFTDSIPLIMRDFKETFPDIAITPVNSSPNELNSGLKNRTIDVALSLIQDFAPEEQESYSSKQLLRDTMCFVLPGDCPFTTDYAFVEHNPLVVFGESASTCYFHHVASCLQRLGIRVPKMIFADSVNTIRAYLESGIGFSVLPSLLAGFFPESTQFIPVPDAYLEYGALWDANSPNAALPLFLDTLDQFLHPQPDATAALPQ